MRRYNSFFVQAWVDDEGGDAGAYRLKVEHIQTGMVTMLTDPAHIIGWLRQQGVCSSAPMRLAEATEAE